MKVTIKTIAEEAGVSEATVSYVINDRGSVSQDKRDQVKAIIKKHHYKPRKRVIPAAPGTKHGTVAIVFRHASEVRPQDNWGDFFMSPLLSGVEEALAAAGVSVSLCRATAAGKLPVGSKKAVDGIVALWGSTSTTLPSVSVFRRQQADSVDVVQPDNDACGAMAAERLVSLGCKQCAVLNPRPLNSALRSRERAFLEQMASHGIEAVTISGDDDECPSPLSLVGRLLSQAPDTDGVFIPGSDVNVAAISMELHKSDKRPSESCNVIACLANIEFLGPLNLGIDFVDIQLRSVGSAAAETLLWRLQHKDAAYRSVQICPRLIKI